LSTPLERDAPLCLYATTARAPVPTPPLRSDARTEIAVVGAGYTGLSAALHLADRGARVTLLEAHEPGWGAAGRNGGQVNAGLKHEPDAVERHLGNIYGPRLVQLAGEAPAYLFRLIARLDIVSARIARALRAECRFGRVSSKSAVSRRSWIAKLTLRATCDCVSFCVSIRDRSDLRHAHGRGGARRYERGRARSAARPDLAPHQ